MNNSENGWTPNEHFSKKGSTTEDAKFDKTLMKDLSRQARKPMYEQCLCGPRQGYVWWSESCHNATIVVCTDSSDWSNQSVVVLPANNEVIPKNRSLRFN